MNLPDIAHGLMIRLAIVILLILILAGCATNQQLLCQNTMITLDNALRFQLCPKIHDPNKKVRNWCSINS